MYHFTLNDALNACNGTYIGDQAFLNTSLSDVIIDSRKVSRDCLFVAIDGERINGHQFIPEVMAAGALCAVSQEIIEHPTFPYILVESTNQALLDIAKSYRDSFPDLKVVAVTGSVGKTSSKEMISSVLSQKYKVHKTLGNLNNSWGLPLSIFTLLADDEISVLELGVNHFDEMRPLAHTASPDICVITNIGIAHLEFFKTREGILKEKTTMLLEMKENGSIILNGDDDLLRFVPPKKGITPLLFGMDPTFDTYADEVESLGLRGSSIRIHTRDVAAFTCKVPVPGFHMVLNALAAASVGSALSLTTEEIKAGIETFTSTSGRNHIIDTGQIIIVDDCYNANPVSMKAALDVLGLGIGRKVAILGDMGELGPDQGSLHQEIGTYAAKKGINLLIGIGSLAKNMVESARIEDTHTKTLWFSSKEDFISRVQEIIDPGDNVLVKASNGMQFPTIVDALKHTF